MTGEAADRPRSERRILLLDADQFFVQVARLEDPDGAGREDLLLVGGTPERRGVVAAASYGTRRFGVRSAMPMAQALRLCPDAKVVSVPRDACGRKSREIRAVLRRFAPVVEAASIDEAYLDLTGTERLYRDLTLDALARRIQAAVHEATSIVVSLGGGTSKLVAKMASRPAKPGGVHIVEPGREIEFMAGHRLADLPGVGPVFARELERRGLTTVAAALELEEGALRAIVGDRRGASLYARMRGIDDSEVSSDREQKQISREETFPRDIDDDDELRRELLALSTRVASDLREEGLRARTVTVKLRDSDFRTRQGSRTLPEPVESDRGVHAAARDLLDRLRGERRCPARLLGVALSQLDAGQASGQLALFQDRGSAAETDRDRTLSRAVDSLRARFGADALRPGRLIGGED